MLFLRHQKIGLAGVLTFTFGILLQFAIVPPIMRMEMKKKIALKKGWPMRDTWSKLPFTMESHIYIFNVTNHKEIDVGAKPILQEVGPFVYDIHQEKVEQIDHEEDDTVSYVLRNVFHFNPQKSNGLSDELEIYFPHTYIMTVSAAGDNKERGSYSSFASRSVDKILGKPDSFFFKTKVKVPLFDGYPIPCGGNDYFEKLTCNVLRERFFDFALRKRGDTFYTSIFGFMNGSYDKQTRIRINRGIKSLKDVGRVVEMSGKANLSIWKDDKCNAFQGTDGSIFPPFAFMKSRDEDITIVNQFLCRKLTMTYDSKVKFSGLKLHRYTLDLGTDVDNVPEEKCYCLAPDKCPRKGIFDLFRCTNTPNFISNPHFYNADPYYLTRVDTLTPDREKHLTYIDFDPFTGAPIRAHVRAQLNMELMEIPEFRLMRNHAYAMLPLAWTDEVTVLPDFLIDEIKLGHKQVKLVKAVEFMLMTGGFAMCAAATYLNYRSRKVTELDLKPTSPPDNGSAVKVDSEEVESPPDSEEPTTPVTPKSE